MKTENDNRTEAPVGWTTLEQSMLLVSCGLDAKSADMYYEQKFDDYGTPLYEWRLVAKKSRAIEENRFSWRLRYVEPCWSLGKLISIIRGCNKKFENVLLLNDADRNTDNVSRVVFSLLCQDIEMPEFTGATELETCVNAIVWLLENKYISNEK